MFGAYQGRRSAYFVVVRDDGVVVGGGGFARLAGADARTCALREMYFLPEIRGLGLGQRRLDLCLEGAPRAGYRTLYLETLTKMGRARARYEKNGFRPLRRALGATGHFGCNSYYTRALR